MTTASGKVSNRAKMCLEAAKRPWGSAWSKLTPEMREAFVCRELVYMMLGQADSSIEANPKAVLLALLEDNRQALQQLDGEQPS